MKLTKGVPEEFNPATDAQRWDHLPVIDFSPWYRGSYHDRAVLVAELFEAATTSGFFYLSGHGVPDSCISAAYSASAEFHRQPAQYKEKYAISLSKCHRGWASFDQTSGFQQDGKLIRNYYEAFDLSFEVPANDPRACSGFGLVGPNVWPDLFGFRRDVSAYYDAIYELGRALMSAFELSLDLDPSALLKSVNVPTSQLRLLKYVENDAPCDELNAGISAHSDYECFTILHTSGPGLQVLSYDGHWVEAPPQPNTFLVNIGDCLEALTGGKFKATQHRVINLGQERFSLPFFFSVDYETEVRPLPDFSSDAAISKYPPFQAGEHLWARTIQTFPYLKELHEKGSLSVDFSVAEENPFRRVSIEEMS